jgi:hypothetical protein
MDAKLRVVRGPLSGKTIRVATGKLLIGREKDCQLRLDSKLVSAHHCVLLLDEYTLRIRDLGSRNGTIVNGTRIGTHESILLHDDNVSIDQLTFQVDLSQSAHDVELAVAEAEPFVAPNALDETGIFGGDTAECVPTEFVAFSSPQRMPQEASADSEAGTETGVPTCPESLAPIVSERPHATSISPAEASRRAPAQKVAIQEVVGQALARTHRANKLAAGPKPAVKSKQNTAGKNARRSTTASSTGVRVVLVLGGLIALVGMIGVGALFLGAPRQAIKYETPQSYVDFNPKSFATMLRCEVPETWKQQFRGGQNIGPMRARFTDGRLVIEISENLTGTGIREVVVAMRQKAEAAHRDAPPAEQIHEYQRQQASDNFKSYSEEPRSRGITTKGYGEARLSDFTATEGLFGTEIKGCRATAANQLRQLTVICKCPPSMFQDAKPVFEKVIASLNCGVVAAK